MLQARCHHPIPFARCQITTSTSLRTLTIFDQDLPRPGAQVYLDSQAIASWTYDNASHTLISYDTPEAVGQKVEYIKSRKLGGAMWWETSGDQPSSSDRSLINTAATAFSEDGSNGMENSENCLDYPQSKYDNLRQGMPNE